MIKKKESGEIIKPTTNNAPPKKMPRNDYSRYEQENFNKSQTGGFQIDTLGTNASKSFNSLVAGKKLVLRVDPSPKKFRETINCLRILRKNIFQISAEKSRYSGSRTTSPVKKGSWPYTNYHRSSLKHVYHYTCQCTKTSRRIQICSTRGTSIQSLKYKV